MRLERLAARRFRNLEAFDLDTSAQFVVFHGENAQGKTNSLEAIYYLATLKPLRGARPRDLVQWETSDATVTGRVCNEQVTRMHRVDLVQGRRTLKLDQERCAALEDWFTGIRAIAFTPQDGEIVAGEPAKRRRWVDRAAFTARPAHLDAVRRYRRALDQKAAALKTGVDDSMLDVLDEQLATAGAALAERRCTLLTELDPYVREMHEAIVGLPCALSLRYRTRAEGVGEDARAEALRRAFATLRPRERQRRSCLAGPQTDDVVIEIDGRSARNYGSRGQIRSLVLSLKLAELMAARARGMTPLFLLDDVSSELDRGRTGRLVTVLRDLDAQVFASTTDPSHMEHLPEPDTTRVEVDNGVLRS